MKTYALAALSVALLLSACATVPSTESEIASCRQMEADMSLETKHDHGEMKSQGRNPMNISHERCQQILKQQ